LKTSLTLTGGAVGAVWIVLQAFQSISDRPLNMEKLRAEIRGQMLTNIEKARQQHVPLTDEEKHIISGGDTHILTFSEEQWIHEMAQRNALKYYQSSQDSLKRLPLRVDDLSVKITDDTRRPTRTR
jgi:hypothetical protein